MAEEKDTGVQKPQQPQERPQNDYEKRDKGGRVTSDQAPPERPKRG